MSSPLLLSTFGQSLVIDSTDSWIYDLEVSAPAGSARMLLIHGRIIHANGAGDILSDLSITVAGTEVNWFAEYYQGPSEWREIGIVIAVPLGTASAPGSTTIRFDWGDASSALGSNDPGMDFDSLIFGSVTQTDAALLSSRIDSVFTVNDPTDPSEPSLTGLDTGLLVVSGANSIGGPISWAGTADFTVNDEQELSVLGFRRSAYTVSSVASAPDMSWTFTDEIVTWAFAVYFTESCDTTYNCDCESDASARTRISMREEIIDRMGFVDLLSTVTTKTLTELRNFLMARTGFAAQIGSEPPGMTTLLDSFINEAQDVVYRRYAYDGYGASAPSAMTDGADTVSVDHVPLQLLAVANAKAHYGQDSKNYYDQFERYMTELLARHPLNLEATVDSILRSAQEELFHRYDAVKTERIFTWNVTAGTRYYGLNSNVACCNVDMSRHKIGWVGVETTDGEWYELHEGINPSLYTRTDEWQGWPSRYEVRQCLEIFPAPDATISKIRIKGFFGLKAFASDTDTSTIDTELLFTYALAQAKAHYGQRDADALFQISSKLADDLVAGSHHTARYVPGASRKAIATRPNFLPLSES